jgi:hypothetical protein
LNSTLAAWLRVRALRRHLVLRQVGHRTLAGRVEHLEPQGKLAVVGDGELVAHLLADRDHAELVGVLVEHQLGISLAVLGQEQKLVVLARRGQPLAAHVGQRDRAGPAELVDRRRDADRDPQHEREEHNRPDFHIE